MRTFDLSKREPAKKQIKAILKKHCIAELDVTMIKGLMDVSYTNRTITLLMLDMNIDFQVEKYAFIDKAINVALDKIAPIDLAFDVVAEKLKFEISPRKVAARLKVMDIDIVKIRDDFIKTQLIEILNDSEETPRYKYSHLLEGRNAYQSPPTVRRQLNEIRDTPELRARLDNPDHPALTETPKCKTAKTTN